MLLRALLACLLLCLCAGVSGSQPQDLPEYLAREVGTLQARLATLDARITALGDAMLKAEAESARQRALLYGLIKDNELAQRRALDALKERQDRQEGESRGLSSGWGILTGIIGMIVAVAALINARRRAA
jgi:hypothetical protein